MKRFNVILLVDVTGEKILMCRRVKPPYQGLLNLVGGKLEPGEDGYHAAYRELREESGVTPADVRLHHLMTFTYPAGCSGISACELQAYVGRLRHDVKVRDEVNPLQWVSINENFFDMTRFSGEGNIGHMVENVCRYCPEMLWTGPSEVSLVPLTEAELPVLAYYRRSAAAELLPMLAESIAKFHDGRYYEQFTIRVDGCTAGRASLYAHEDGSVSEGIEVYPTFRQCGFAVRALEMLTALALEKGYRLMTAQIRTDNAASIALHKRLGFRIHRTCVNRHGREVYEMCKSIGGEAACGTK